MAVRLGATLGLFSNIFSIIGSIMIFKYIEKLNMLEECRDISPKHLDFIEKYTYFILFSSIIGIFFTWFGIYL